MVALKQTEQLLAKLRAGQEAWSAAEQKALFDSFNDLCRTYSPSAVGPRSESDVFAEIMEVLVNNGFAYSAAHYMDADAFFRVGKELLANGQTKRKSIHGWLDVFRHSGLLKQIYGQERWPQLLLELIRKSDYTLATMLNQRVQAYPSKPIFRVLKGDAERTISWEELDYEVERMACNLLRLTSDMDPADLKIAMLCENNLQMVFFDLACLTSGIVNIMIPANSVPQQIEYIMQQTGAQVILLGNDKQLAKVQAIQNNLPQLRHGILLSGNSIEKWVLSLDALTQTPADAQLKELQERRDKLTAGQLATVMYTSGTTGNPKGIRFSQQNIIYKRFCRALALPEIGQRDRFLSYLPLFHTFGRWLEMTGSLFWAAEYTFMENPALATMIDNMQRVKPTVFISIPKKWMQLYEYITGDLHLETDEAPVISAAIERATGGKLRWGLSAAGYLEPDVFRFFQQHGVHLMSGFGMTEATGGITMTHPDHYSDNSLGWPLPGIEVNLAEDGEMLIRGGYVMDGYFGEADQITLEDGWFPTGDIMRRHDDGHYEIIDRKKEIYKNIKGETIAPQKIENLFRDFEYVQQVFLAGDNKPFNTVLIYPETGNENHLAKMSDKERHNYFSSAVVTVNKFLAPFERILDFRILDRPLDAEHGELTPKGTFKRRNIGQNFTELIESMYRKNYVPVQLGKLEVRVPNWFLREKGCLIGDLQISNNRIRIPKHDVQLEIEWKPDSNEVAVGDFVYTFQKPYLDLQPFLVNPVYWMGNRGLMAFAGHSIFQWYRLDSPTRDIRFVKMVRPLSISAAQVDAFQNMTEGGERTLFGLNMAVSHLLDGGTENVARAIAYFQVILADDHLPIYPLVKALVQQPLYARDLSTRRALFICGMDLFSGAAFKAYLNTYLQVEAGLIDPELSQRIVKSRKTDADLAGIYKLIEEAIENLDKPRDLRQTALPGLFHILADFGIIHPTKYKNVRQFIVRYQLYRDKRNVATLASMARERLLKGFRSWLGENQTVTVDIETGEEYQWKDVIIFEEGIIGDEKTLLLDAFEKTMLLREAIFLFSNGTMVRLYDIPPGGIWVSVLLQDEQKSTYRVSVQTRFQGSFDFIVNYSQAPVDEAIVAEIQWLILAGARTGGMSLLEDFGGLWREYRLWTKDYYPGDTVNRFFERTNRRDSEENRNRLFHIWPFFVRTAISAHVNFWRRTGYSLQLEDMSTANIVIPPHDYQTGMRLGSIARRTESSDPVRLLEQFHRQFIQPMEKDFPFIVQDYVFESLFAGVLDSEGEDAGRRLLKEVEPKISNPLKRHLSTFLETLNRSGFVPRQMHFAICRFHRWFKLNSDAALAAQAQTLNEMYDTYQLLQLEEKRPETRTTFFLETVFRDSDDDLRSYLVQLARRQHRENLSHDEVLAYISKIQKECALKEKEIYFLSRISYPHLKPTDSARLLASPSIADVVVNLTDDDGAVYQVRKAISPKEISRLHQLFLEASMPVNFSPEHRFLVAVSDNGYVIGGLFYKPAEGKTVYMEKIVVSSKLRRKGISDGLMNEFFHRLRDEKVNHVTTGFFRPEYFYRFGFKVERKYAGLVKDLRK